MRQNPSRALGCSELQVPPKKQKQKLTCFGAQSYAYAETNRLHGRIVTNFCTGVGVHDVITCADLYDYRLRGLGVVRHQILGFSIELRRRPYNTLALPCDCVILKSRQSFFCAFLVLRCSWSQKIDLCCTVLLSLCGGIDGSVTVYLFLFMYGV